MSSQNTFQRLEKKYLLNEQQYQLLLAHLKGHMVADQYERNMVQSIYFDTPDFQLIRTSLEKPVYKEKLRMRSYGVPQAQDAVFLELKKKYKGVVYKRRLHLPLQITRHYLYEQKRLPPESQVMREIDWFMQYYPQLGPAMYIGYQRKALCGVQVKDLRVTFDKQIIWRQEELDLSQGFWGQRLLPEGWYLMEIKAFNAFPLWLTRMLDQQAIFPISYSKYGNAYRAFLQQTDTAERREVATYAV